MCRIKFAFALVCLFNNHIFGVNSPKFGMQDSDHLDAIRKALGHVLAMEKEATRNVSEGRPKDLLSTMSRSHSN